MKTKLYSAFTAISILLFTATCFSQIYNYTDDITGVPAAVDPNATGSNLARVNGATTVGLPCTDGFSSQNFSSTATYVSSLAAIQFSVTANAGYQLNIQSFSVGNRRSSSGPSLNRLAYSTDGGVNWIDNGSNYNPPTGSCGAMTTLPWNMADFSSTSIVLFRIYGFSAPSVNGQHQLKNVLVIGTATLIPVLGCTDPAACNYDPLANVNDGSCVYPGCTDPLACNYNASASCDDGSCIISGAPCDDGEAFTTGDFIQPDCNCLGYPVNDEKAGAMPLIQSYLYTCNFAIASNFTFATTSPDAYSTVITGEDLWYSFVAATSAVRVEISSSSFNGVVELQNASGTMLDQENVIAATGLEYLNKDGLVQGDTYYVIIRNYDSSIGDQWIDICPQYVPDSRIANPQPLYNSPCNSLKADWVGAWQYQFVFTNQTTAAVTSLTTTNTTFFKPSNVPGMQWDETFDTEVNPTFQLYDAAGNLETAFVLSDEITALTFAPHPLMQIRVQDRCPAGPNFIGSSIAGEPFVCMSVDYQWEFTRTDIPAAPIYHLRGYSNRFLQLNTVPGLVQGGVYDVRVRPVFAYAYGDWGAVHCMSIVPVSSMMVENEDEGQNTLSPQLQTVWSADENFDKDEFSTASLYPNPNRGNEVYINLTGMMASDIISLECFDETGRPVGHLQSEVMSDEDLVIHFSNELAIGFYTICAKDIYGKTVNEKFVVMR